MAGLNKYPYKIDIPVLIIFFSRPEQFARVFEQVKIARPSKLYLYQDGPRENREDDVIGIKKCREIASHIDWDCEVHTFYQRKNMGCDPSEYIAQKWMFTQEEMGIVLEDDDIPAQSFFPFCRELLLKYKDDTRINMICGMNNTEVCEYSPYDYLFSYSGSICGWASWKRVIDTWDPRYSILDDSFNLNQMKRSMDTVTDGKQHVRNCIRHRKSGRAHYESILSTSMFTNHRLNIVPTKNMISNIGVVANSTHSADHMELLPRGIRRIFCMPVYEIKFPMKHPPYVIEDVEFRKRLYQIMGKKHPAIKMYRRLEGIVLLMKYKGLMGTLVYLVGRITYYIKLPGMDK